MNKILLPLTVVALCFGAQQAMAANSTAQGTAKAKIITPLSITAVTGANGDMNFGTMISTQAHTVTLDNAHNRTGSVSTMLVEDSSNPPHSGTFTITNGGTAAVAASLVLPDSTTIGSSGTNLTVDEFSSDFSSPIPTGNSTVLVGATLHVPAGAAAGEYTGQYTVTLSY